MTPFETASRPDAWSASNAHCSVRFQLAAHAEPDVLCRVLNLLAMQYLIPQQLTVTRQAERLHLDLQVGELTWHRAEVIGNRMRNLVDVEWVELHDIRQPAAMVQVG